MEDDIPGTLADAAPLASGLNRATIGPNDRDVWRFEIEEGLYYRIDPLDDGTPDSAEDLSISLLDGNGVVLENSSRFFTDDTLSFNAEADGVRFIDVPQADTSFSPGSYALDFDNADTVGATRATAASLSLGEATAVELQAPDDIDAFSFDAGTGLAYGLILSRTPSSVPGRVSVMLFDADREQIVTSSNVAFDLDQEVAVGLGFLGPDDPAVTLEITGGIGGFALLVNDDDTVRADVLTDKTLSLVEPVLGRLDVVTDDDWYRLELPPGERVLLRADSDPGIDSGNVARLDIYDSIGRPLPAGSFERIEQDVIIYEPSGSDPVFLEAAGRGGRLATEPLEFRLVAEAIGGRSLGEGLSVDQALDIAFLYEAGLDRDNRIDRAGLNFWIDAREDGLGYVDIARSFLASEEFTASYGAVDTLSDRALVEALYANVLDREGEAAGTDFWTEIVARDGFSRADLLIAFAESEENREDAFFIQRLEEVEPGFWDFTA